MRTQLYAFKQGEFAIATDCAIAKVEQAFPASLIEARHVAIITCYHATMTP